MDISIVKSESGAHRAVVARPGEAAVQFALHDYGAVLPHDLVHFVVEAELGLELGFWGLIAAGAKLQSVQAFGARAPRRITPQDDPLITAHIDELLAAEGLVAAFSGLPGMERDPDLEPDLANRIRAPGDGPERPVYGSCRVVLAGLDREALLKRDGTWWGLQIEAGEVTVSVIASGRRLRGRLRRAGATRPSGEDHTGPDPIA